MLVLGLGRVQQQGRFSLYTVWAQQGWVVVGTSQAARALDAHEEQRTATHDTGADKLDKFREVIMVRYDVRFAVVDGV